MAAAATRSQGEGSLDSQEVRSQLAATLEEITDEGGRVLGVIRSPARFRAAKSYLSNGGFLVVTREEADGAFVGVEYDAFYDKKTRRYYPSGYSQRVFKVADLEAAVQRVLTYLESPA